VRGLELSGFTYLSRKQERFAKTVTNLLILLSVLCLGVYFMNPSFWIFSKSDFKISTKIFLPVEQ
jgi:hypothetical protein